MKILFRVSVLITKTSSIALEELQMRLRGTVMISKAKKRRLEPAAPQKNVISLK